MIIKSKKKNMLVGVNYLDEIDKDLGGWKNIYFKHRENKTLYYMQINENENYKLNEKVLKNIYNHNDKQIIINDNNIIKFKKQLIGYDYKS